MLNCLKTRVQYLYKPEIKYSFVDLGLPSGTLWATCNIGATDPTLPGDYFTYGNIIPIVDGEELMKSKNLNLYKYLPFDIPNSEDMDELLSNTRLFSRCGNFDIIVGRNNQQLIIPKGGVLRYSLDFGKFIDPIKERGYENQWGSLWSTDPGLYMSVNGNASKVFRAVVDGYGLNLR